ncbi:19997_t:CDS:2, partial [Racocetra persica]
MPFSDPKKKKEHDRLSQAISRAKKTGKDVKPGLITRSEERKARRKAGTGRRTKVKASK